MPPVSTMPPMSTKARADAPARRPSSEARSAAQRERPHNQSSTHGRRKRSSRHDPDAGGARTGPRSKHGPSAVTRPYVWSHFQITLFRSPNPRHVRNALLSGRARTNLSLPQFNDLTNRTDLQTDRSTKANPTPSTSCLAASQVRRTAGPLRREKRARLPRLDRPRSLPIPQSAPPHLLRRHASVSTQLAREHATCQHGRSRELTAFETGDEVIRPPPPPEDKAQSHGRGRGGRTQAGKRHPRPEQLIRRYKPHALARINFVRPPVTDRNRWRVARPAKGASKSQQAEPGRNNSTTRNDEGDSTVETSTDQGGGPAEAAEHSGLFGTADRATRSWCREHGPPVQNQVAGA